MEDFGICQRLISSGIIDEKLNLLDEDRFKEFLFGLYMYYLTFERYKKFLSEAIENQNDIMDNYKGERIFAIPVYPFRFIGINDITLFVGEMSNPHLIFPDPLSKLFSNFDHISKTEPKMEKEIIRRELWKKHICSRKYYNKFCETCLTDFSIFALENINDLADAFNINSFLKINLDHQVFMELISQESVVDLGQDQNLCKCKKQLKKNWNYCPYCSTIVDKSIFKKKTSNNPEKIFNAALSLFLSIKKGYNSYNANYTLDKEFENEVDVYLQKEHQFKFIETTVSSNLTKEYLLSKIKTFSLIDSSIKNEFESNKKIEPDCSMLIWSLSRPNELEKMKKLVNNIFSNQQKFKIITSGYNLKNTNKLTMSQIELNDIRTAFDDILYQLIVAL